MPAPMPLFCHSVPWQVGTCGDLLIANSPLLDFSLQSSHFLLQCRDKASRIAVASSNVRMHGNNFSGGNGTIEVGEGKNLTGVETAVLAGNAFGQVQVVFGDIRGRERAFQLRNNNHDRQGLAYFSFIGGIPQGCDVGAAKTGAAAGCE